MKSIIIAVFAFLFGALIGSQMGMAKGRQMEKEAQKYEEYEPSDSFYYDYCPDQQGCSIPMEASEER